MRNVIAIFVMAIIATAGIAHATTVTGTYDEAKAASVKDGKPLLVEFYTEW